MLTQRRQRVEDIVSLELASSLARVPFRFEESINLSDYDLPKIGLDDSYTSRRFNIPRGKDTLDFHSSLAKICKEARHTGKQEKLLSGLYEAFRNAWQHGNGKNPEKAIEVSYKSTDNDFEVVVSDEGGKISTDFVPFILLHRQGMDKPLSFYNFSPTAKILEENSGNGTFVMHMTADEVNYFKNYFGGLSVQLILRK